ncbi:MAG: tetratricopeptide repeat protein [Gammaproteobacteria bacterium]|nr:tetratricopeptide repeat protein [Gammaproteobacteria bacterium]
MESVNFRRHEIESKSFLVVDDFGDMRSMIKGMLATIGVTDIDLAANGADAVTAMEKRRYDIVLCDYNLGAGKNGQQVLEEARHRELIGLGSMFIMVTAENTREIVMSAVEYEPDAYLTKPFTKDLLRSRLVRLAGKQKDLEDVEHAVRSKEFEKAVELLDEKLAVQTRNLGELTKLKAEFCLRAGSHDKAEAVYREALSRHDLPWARLGLGRVLYATGRLDEAKMVFDELSRDNPGFTAAYDWLARTLRSMNRHRDAQATLQKAVELSPQAILRQKALGQLALHNEDHDTAERALSHAVKLGHHSVYKEPLLYAGLARAKAGKGAGEQGLKILAEMEKVFRGQPTSALYSAMVEGEIHSAAGRTQEAEDCLVRAGELYRAIGDEVPAHLTLELARTSGKLGNHEQAKALLKDAVRNNHAETELLREVGDLVRDLNMDIDPESFIGDIRKEIVHLNNRGVQMARAGRLQEAVGLFEEAAAAMPGNKVVNLNCARVLIMSMRETGLNRAHLEKVHEFLNRVQRADPENPQLRRVQNMYQQLVKESA